MSADLRFCGHCREFVGHVWGALECGHTLDTPAHEPRAHEPRAWVDRATGTARYRATCTLGCCWGEHWHPDTDGALYEAGEMIAASPVGSLAEQVTASLERENDWFRANPRREATS